MIASVEIDIRRGDHEEYDGTVTDEDGVAQDITDSVIKFTAKANLADDDESAVIALSSENAGEIIITDAENGLFTVYISEEVTTELTPRNYYYDIQMRLDGKPFTVAYGILTVYADVTRDLQA